MPLCISVPESKGVRRAMQKTELLDLIHNGENSGVEFKLDAVDNT
jgi:hypothetical protein